MASIHGAGIFAQALPHAKLKTMVCMWLDEDTPSMDFGGMVVGTKQEQAVILAKSTGIMCGQPFIDAVFSEVGCKVEWKCKEGDLLQPTHDGVLTIGVVRGSANNLLLGERVALNVLTRASGVATMARNLSQLARKAGWHGRVAGTRKTTPGFRLVEKYALLVGGMDTHRYDLSSMIMLKDNHIWSCDGDIGKAVKTARAACGFSTKIEVECRSVLEAMEAAESGADVVMLDNFTPEALHPAAAEVKHAYPHVLVDASGGVTIDTLPAYLSAHVDVVSLSAPTQGYSTLDFSMKIKKQGRDPRNPLVESLAS